ncbi:hypothetical protein KQX54_002404 [Cotesia glomerata]|uniref:Uncharacterized protein n=1 Tax=Cotesia glomerata TaxID=32391 RepID=A0AAV7HZW2_COTGL|nr:hypothetical protein KQX54_002404 [Cotesia glomerata]
MEDSDDDSEKAGSNKKELKNSKSLPAREDEDSGSIDENNRPPADLLTAIKLLRKDGDHSGGSEKNSSESRNSRITHQKKHIPIKKIETVQVLFHRQHEDDALEKITLADNKEDPNFLANENDDNNRDTDTTHHQGEGATTETATVSPREKNLETKKNTKPSKRKENRCSVHQKNTTTISIHGIVTFAQSVREIKW